MKTKSLLIALTAAVLIGTSMSAVHAYANLFTGNMTAGQWQSKSLTLGGNPMAWTQVRVDIRCMSKNYPPGDFDIYLVDQWGNCRARGTSYGPDSISANMPGTHCTLWINCAHSWGMYRCSLAVENSPLPGGGG